ncbi:19294_t:CDS:2 [Funneliformis geosporum]|uniref:19294_t:CDS:1 n=1 Tax=Funneliformis geosporum TaxID=1117311 RepID=A0A9W4WT58_9GLOM|nr:19294_t:CDS:2 [Funneliformis geosporum]
MADKRSYFDLKNNIEWNIVEFHRFFIEKNKYRQEKLEKAITLQETAKAVAISTVWISTTTREFCLMPRYDSMSDDRRRRKGGVLDTVWTSVEVELKEKLKDLQVLVRNIIAIESNRAYT